MVRAATANGGPAGYWLNRGAWSSPPPGMR
jgi:hypothetical protein